jgi:hypothetical protein
MANPDPRSTNAKKTGFVIGRAAFARISAVEGIRLTLAMEKRTLEAQQKGMSAEEYRETIKGAYRKT